MRNGPCTERRVLCWKSATLWRPVAIDLGGNMKKSTLPLTLSLPRSPDRHRHHGGLRQQPCRAGQVGLNTLLLSASTTAVPDVVALVATAQNDGILHITGTTGSNAFAVATVNVGASASITATANTGAATLPLAISLCQTNPMSGQCISSIGSTVTTTINA